jgi:hypothetical protein
VEKPHSKLTVNNIQNNKVVCVRVEANPSADHQCSLLPGAKLPGKSVQEYEI